MRGHECVRGGDCVDIVVVVVVRPRGGGVLGGGGGGRRVMAIFTRLGAAQQWPCGTPPRPA